MFSGRVYAARSSTVKKHRVNAAAKLFGKRLDKLVINLPRPMPASNDCLPHAAMNLGSARGVGLHPRVGMVSRLVFQSQMGAWCFFRLDKDGGFVGESWHPTKEDALYQARREFGIEAKLD